MVIRVKVETNKDTDVRSNSKIMISGAWTFSDLKEFANYSLFYQTHRLNPFICVLKFHPLEMKKQSVLFRQRKSFKESSELSPIHFPSHCLSIYH